MIVPQVPVNELIIDQPLIVGGSAYAWWKLFADGRVCGVKPLMFHWTMHVDINDTGYEDSYCYEVAAAAVLALNHWNGEGDPLGWHRHHKTGRRRINGDPSTEYINW